MDDIDLAQQNDELFRRQALTAHFNRRSSEYGSILACGEAVSVGRLKPCMSGLCRDCGDEIEPARLAARPDAVRCIDCQTDAERRQRRG
jgi:RNA polymerase-binding transcription factor DksA